MFNLSSLKQVILGLSFKDIREFARGLSLPDTNIDDGMIMDTVTDWAENYEPPEDETGALPVTNEEVLPVTNEAPPPPPEPVEERDIHLDIPSDTDFMILTAKVPNDMAENFQKALPDSKAIAYACDFVEKREAMNDKYWTIYGRNCWEQFFT